MVELCELKLMQGGGGDLDIDQAVAQLEFDNSTSLDRSSLFGSVAVMDPTMGASMNDSLDTEALRARCENNKYDYKLTFEDSGQWTTSGIGTSEGNGTDATNSPPTPSSKAVSHAARMQRLRGEGDDELHSREKFGLRLLEELNNGDPHSRSGDGGEEQRRNLIENLLNNAILGGSDDPSPVTTTPGAHTTLGGMTTWGRIRASEPFEERTSSLPELVKCSHDKAAGVCCICSSGQRTTGVNGEWGARPLSENLQLGGGRQDTAATVGATTSHNGGGSCGVAAATRRKSHLPPQSLLANFVEQQHQRQQQQHLFPSFSSPSALSCRPLSTVAVATAGASSNRRPAAVSGNNYRQEEGAGRHVDVNDNEIGFVPDCSAPIQQRSADRWQLHRRQAPSGSSSFGSTAAKPPPIPGSGAGRIDCNFATTPPFSAHLRPSASAAAAVGLFRGRTFADLSPSQTTPDLKFLSLSHRIPAICRPSMSLDDMLKRAAKQGCNALLADCLNDDRLLFQATSSEMLMHMNALIEEGNAAAGGGGGGPDSGLGSSSSPSSSSTTTGPLHIDDWASLSILLPKHVVDACSFFKSNVSLLTGSPSSNTVGTADTRRSNLLSRTTSTNSTPATSHPHRTLSGEGCCPPFTDGRAKACRTCFGVHSYQRLMMEGEDHGAAGRCCCTMTTSEIAFPTTRPALTSGRHGALPSSSTSAHRPTTAASKENNLTRLTMKLKTLHSEELAIIGLPVYDQKRNLIERVVEGVAELFRGASSVVLWSAIERLLADGLKEAHSVWAVVVEATQPGPVTNSIFQLVKSLEASEKPENSRLCFFLKELLKLHSLDGWLSYLVLKEAVLRKHYDDSAFLLKANTAYRSLFWRLVESLESLTVHNRRKDSKSDGEMGKGATNGAMAVGCWGSASRLPPDSRVPKSSSVPAKITAVLDRAHDESEEASLLGRAIKNRETLELEGTQRKEPSQALKGQQLTPSMTPSDASFKSCASEMGRSSRIPLITTGSSLPGARRSRSSLPSPSSQLNCKSSELSGDGRSRSSLRSAAGREYTPLRVIARVRETVGQKGHVNGGGRRRWLPLDAGEKVRILSIRGPWSRCCRLHSRHGLIMNGVVPTRTLDLC